MSLEIIDVLDINNKNERLYLQTTTDCNLGLFMVIDTTYNSQGQITDRLRHTFFFPPYDVPKGSHVLLYTIGGRDNKTQNQDGSTTYHIYWGLNSSVWNNTGDCAAVLQYKVIDNKAV